MRDEAGVVAKFGIKPQSIPDFLAVVGDTADGFPGLPGWGVKAAALTLSQYPHLESIPKDWREWHPSIRRARLLSESLHNSWSEALLFRTLATLRLDVPVFENVEDLRWKGPRPSFEDYCRRMKSRNHLLAYADRLNEDPGCLGSSNSISPSDSEPRKAGAPSIQPAGGHMGDKKKAKWGCRKTVN